MKKVVVDLLNLNSTPRSWKCCKFFQIFISPRILVAARMPVELITEASLKKLLYTFSMVAYCVYSMKLQLWVQPAFELRLIFVDCALPSNEITVEVKETGLAEELVYKIFVAITFVETARLPGWSSVTPDYTCDKQLLWDNAGAFFRATTLVSARKSYSSTRSWSSGKMLAFQPRGSVFEPVRMCYFYTHSKGSPF